MVDDPSCQHVLAMVILTPMARLTSFLALLCAALTMTGAGGDYVRLTVRDTGPTPFSLVRYEVSTRGRNTTCVHRRQLPGHGEALHGMGLLPAAETEDLWRLLKKNDALRLPTVQTPEGFPWSEVTRWAVEISLEGQEHRFEVSAPIHQADRRYHRLITAVRGVVESLAGEQPYRNIFFPDDVRGWLDVDGVPPARVIIDGFDTRMETPIFGYELESGDHEIQLRTKDGRYERTYRFRIGPTMTTRLKVDLR